MQKNPLKIRPATLNDALKIRNLHVYSIRRLCASAYNQKQIEAWSNNKTVKIYCDAMTKKKRLIYVASINSRIVGFVIFAKNEINALYIHPKFIRQNIASKLLARAEKILKQHGKKTFYLSSTLNAFPFYLAQGYKKIRRTHRLLNGTKIPCIKMQKKL